MGVQRLNDMSAVITQLILVDPEFEPKPSTLHKIEPPFPGVWKSIGTGRGTHRGQELGSGRTEESEREPPCSESYWRLGWYLLFVQPRTQRTPMPHLQHRSRLASVLLWFLPVPRSHFRLCALHLSLLGSASLTLTAFPVPAPYPLGVHCVHRQPGVSPSFLQGKSRKVRSSHRGQACVCWESSGLSSYPFLGGMG